MNQNNLILTAIREYLVEKGYRTSQYTSARVGDPPMICGPPSISVATENGVVAVRLHEGLVKVYYNSTNNTRYRHRQVAAVEVTNPTLFDVLESYCTNPDQNDPHPARKD